MDKTYPDKWIRRAIYTAINGTVVGGYTVNCFDYRAGIQHPKAGVIMGQQSNEVVKDTKCDYRWRHTIMLEIFDRISDTGNAGSRAFADDVTEMVKDAIINLQLDVASGLEIIGETHNFPGDQNIPDGTEILYRKFLRIIYLIN